MTLASDIDLPRFEQMVRATFPSVTWTRMGEASAEENDDPDTLILVAMGRTTDGAWIDISWTRGAAQAWTVFCGSSSVDVSPAEGHTLFEAIAAARRAVRPLAMLTDPQLRVQPAAG